jgi:glycine/D-amino acid oxidase-like deaminating enzyme/nitrite reductase/ring-hydroxylating ferredoxin subunit
VYENVGNERTTSLWMQTEVAPNAPRLRQDGHCDILIVGAGIAGLSCAYELADAGRSVIVIDRGAIGFGMTARTTAHLAPICDDAISELIKLRGVETARLFQESQEAAVDRIEALVREHNINCNFRRLDGFLFPALNMDRAEAGSQLNEEYKAAKQAKAAVEHAKGMPFKDFKNAPALRYPRQATFHPLKYLKALVAAIEQKGGKIFAHSPVVKIEEQDKQVKVTVENGASVTAARAVFATNSPINDRVALHSKMAPYRTYAMAFTIERGTLPDALYWDMADPYHYVRLNPGPGNVDYLIAGGADHKTGTADDGAVRFEAVEAWIRQLVPDLGKEVCRWSGQVMDTIDYCAFIGRNPGSENVFVVTGDSGQGMTHGVLSSLLLRELIISGKSRWQEVYEPSRKTPSGLLNYLSENVTAIKNFAEYAEPGEIGSVEELASDEGGILRDGKNIIAAYRDKHGKLHLHSAACTHLGCVVHWNSTEICWDCPCHGSQFAATGEVLNGPAIRPLKAYVMKNARAVSA